MTESLTLLNFLCFRLELGKFSLLSGELMTHKNMPTLTGVCCTETQQSKGHSGSLKVCRSVQQEIWFQAWGHKLGRFAFPICSVFPHDCSLRLYWLQQTNQIKTKRTTESRIVMIQANAHYIYVVIFLNLKLWPRSGSLVLDFYYLLTSWGWDVVGRSFESDHTTAFSRIWHIMT